MVLQMHEFPVFSQNEIHGTKQNEKAETSRSFQKGDGKTARRSIWDRVKGKILREFRMIKPFKSGLEGKKMAIGR